MDVSKYNPSICDEVDCAFNEWGMNVMTSVPVRLMINFLFDTFCVAVNILNTALGFCLEV